MIASIGQDQIIIAIVIFIFVTMMNDLARGKQSANPVFDLHDVERVKPIGIAPGVRRVGAAVPIATALACG